MVINEVYENGGHFTSKTWEENQHLNDTAVVGVAASDLIATTVVDAENSDQDCFPLFRLWIGSLNRTSVRSLLVII